MIKHKLISLFVALVSAANLLAYDAYIDGIYYNLNSTDMTAEVTNETGDYAVQSYSGSITIPASISYNQQTYSVTTIGSYAFSSCRGLTGALIIPNSVTEIGYGAFAYCSGLTSVTIPNSVKMIGEDAFYRCTSLTKTNYTGTIADWCKILFDDSDANPMCYSHNFFINDVEVKDLVIPEGVESIGYYAFSGCSGLTGALIIPNSVTTIGNGAFSECSGLTSVTIGNSVTTIGKNAFYNCSSLTSVTIPNSVKKIGNSAFYKCSSLTSVTIPNSVTTIESSVFSGCSSLTSVTIPNSVTTIGDKAFSGCSSLTSVTLNSNAICSKTYTSSSNIGNIFGSQVEEYIIGNSVTEIGNYAFYNCSSLTSATIGNSVTTIADYAFYHCSDLASVTLNSNAICGKEYTSSSNIGNIFGSQVEEYIIGNSVTTIGEYAFSGCSGLTSVTIGNSVTTIGERAFEDCSGLTSVTIPNSVTTIEWGAFEDCSSLKKTNYTGTIADWCKINFGPDANPMNYSHNFYINDVEVKDLVIPEGVDTIGEDAFAYCSGLTSVTIPNSVKMIGEDAFYRCTSLTKTNYTGTIADWCKIKFDDYDANPIYYSHNFYINDVEVKDLVIPEGVESIGNYAFRYCSGLTSVTIPNSVTTIGEDAFEYCLGLTKTNYMGNIADWCKIQFGSSQANPMYYSDNFFINDVEVKDLVIPEGVDVIGDYAFSGCSGLTSVTIGNSVTEIGDEAFFYCSGLTGALIIPNSVTTIGHGAFRGCSGLTSVTIPYSVTEIGSSAFSGCYDLASVTIGDAVTTIGYGAFEECPDLTSVFCEAVTPPICEDGCFTIGEYTSLYVPDYWIIDEYREADGWKDFTNIQSYNGVRIDGIHYNISNDHSAWVLSIAEGLYYSGDITIPDTVIYKSQTYSVTAIGDYAFRYCSGLTSVTIPNSVTTIGERAFEDCRGLTSVTIGNSVTTIGNYAFFYCTSLTSVTIPNSVTTIGGGAFYYCSGLTSIDVAAANTHYASIDGVLFNYAKDTLIQCPSANSRTEYTIPNSVTTIGDYAFEYCRGLTSLTCEAVTPPACGSNCFYRVDKSIPLYVPAGSIDAYKAANQWKDFTNIQAIVDLDDNHPDNPGFYEIAVSASPQEGGIVSGGGLYADGDTVTISAIANDGYEFVDWSNGCLTNSQDIVLHSRDTALIANFKRTVLDTVIISDEQSISTLPVGAITHVIVRETGKLNLDQATEIRSLTLHQCGNQRAQVTHIERLNDCMVDMVIHLEPAAANAIPNKWYAFAVPFDVDTNSGIRRDGATQVAVPGVDFQIDEYDGALRASTQQGWKRNTDTLKPGKFFMFATNSTANDWRFTKTPDSTLMEQSLITVAEYPAAKKHHAGWNGLSNTLFENANAVCENLTYATIYNNPTNTYQTVLFDSYTFCPTQPFLVQVETQSVVELQPLDILQAPAREVETSITTLSLCQVMENKVPSVDYAYFTITDEETTEYVIGKDLLKMKTANSVVPQIWINAYNLQLAAHEVQMENNMLALALGLYAPNNGEYILRSDNMAISVLCNGVALPAYSDAQGLFWKLNMIQGTNENYSVSIKNLPTAIDQTDNTSINSHKFIKNNHLYILRDGNLYTATGARVK